MFDVSEPLLPGWLAASLPEELLKSITSMTFNKVEHSKFQKWEPRLAAPQALLNEVIQLAGSLRGLEQVSKQDRPGSSGYPNKGSIV